MINAAILAGGRSRRLNGQPKGLIKINNRTIVDHIIVQLGPQVHRVIINANTQQKAYAMFNFPVVGDLIPGHLGPLAGIHSAMHYYLQNPLPASGDSTALNEQLLLILPCDVPSIPDNLVYCLKQKLTYETGCVVARDQNGLQPLIGLFRLTLIDSIKDYLDSGKSKVRDWLANIDMKEYDFSHEIGEFFNVNTPTDIIKLNRNPR